MGVEFCPSENSYVMGISEHGVGGMFGFKRNGDHYLEIFNI
jgi:hypothetical protein